MRLGRARHRVEWDLDPALNRFGGLSDPERVRVIIRVLCGLVALEERARHPSSADREPDEPTDEADQVTRRLPSLGYERIDLRHPARPPTRRELPVLGLTRPF